MSEYDPGTPYDGVPSPKERRRRYGWGSDGQDDAWGAADEDDLAEDDLEIEDLAAGYVDEPAPHAARPAQLPAAPPASGRRAALAPPANTLGGRAV